MGEMFFLSNGNYREFPGFIKNLPEFGLIYSGAFNGGADRLSK